MCLIIRTIYKFNTVEAFERAIETTKRKLIRGRVIYTYSTKFEWTLYIDQGSTPEEYTTSLAYDTYGNITSITDALGNTILLGYDTNNIYLASITNELNYTVTATYDFNTGLLTSVSIYWGFKSMKRSGCGGNGVCGGSV